MGWSFVSQPADSPLIGKIGQQAHSRRAGKAWLASQLERWYDPFSQELIRPQHFRLFHAWPLDAEDKAIDPESIDVASQFTDTIIRVADDKAIQHQFLKCQVE